MNFYNLIKDVLNEFLENNSVLQNLNLIKDGESVDNAAFYLEEVCVEGYDGMESIIKYISCVLQFNANLCKGRNKKCRKRVEFFYKDSNIILNNIKRLEA